MEKSKYLRKHLRIAIVLAALSMGIAPTVAKADLTWFSRANCINNESISWHAWNAEWLWTNSYHYRYGTYQHCENNVGNRCTGGSWQLTWRAAAVHWNEGYSGGWYVFGKHWRWTSSTGTYLLGNTSATGCNPTHW